MQAGPGLDMNLAETHILRCSQNFNPSTGLELCGKRSKEFLDYGLFIN